MPNDRHLVPPGNYMLFVLRQNPLFASAGTTRLVPSPASLLRVQEAPPAPEPTWTRVAREGQSFALAQPTLVRYGVDTRWVQRTLSGTVNCTNTFFGSDPAFGVGKFCETANGTVQTPWITLGAEGASLRLGQTTTVRYGEGTRWVERSNLSGTVGCTAAFFGSDPAPGAAKTCQAPQPTWLIVADENKSFTLATSTRVRYGAQSSWVERTLTGKVDCTNKFFGTDPLKGVLKSCQTLRT
jgi:hypothetical protein